MININEEMYRCILLGKIDRFKEILEQGGDPNYNIRGVPPIFMAINRNKMDFLEILINHPDIDLNITNLQGYTILNECLSTNNNYVLNILLSNLLFVESLSGKGDYPIHTVIKYDRQDLLEKILSYKKNFLNSLNSEGDTPITLAAKLKNKSISEVLIKYNPDLTVVNKKGKTVLDYFIDNNWNEIIRDIENNKQEKQTDESSNGTEVSQIKRRRK